MTIKKNTFQVCFFAACCLFLSAVEYCVPKPLPFMRLGLANLPILLSVKKMNVKYVFILIVCKVLGQSFIGGTTFSYIFLFSVAGSFASGLCILLFYNILKKLNCISNIGLSLIGSFANNFAQLVCSRFILFGENVFYIAPLLLLTGLITGFILGVFANYFENKSDWFNNFYKAYSDTEVFTLQEDLSKKNTFAVFKFLFAIVTIVLLLVVKNIILLWSILLIIFIANEISNKGKVRLLPPLFIIISVVFFSLLTPSGKVLFKIANFKITLDSLFFGLRRSGVLIGMVFASQFAVTKDIYLPGKLGALISFVFSIFENLTSNRIHFSSGKFIKDLDKKFIEIYSKML